MSVEENVLTTIDQHVMTITLNRPKANAFTTEMVVVLQNSFKHAEKDPQVRSVILTGAGKIFSAGQDLDAFQQHENSSLREHLLVTYNALVMQICKLEKPVIAAINGAVAGASLGVVLACDLRIASSSAKFRVGFLGIGLALDSGISVTLPALIGLGRAKEYAFTNDVITADQALSWGLINRLVPAEDLTHQAAAWAAELAQGPLGAMALTKRAFNKAAFSDLEKMLDYEAHLQDVAGNGNEHKEGLSAFMEKRPPKYI